MANANPIRVSGKVPGPPCNALCRLNVVLASWGIDARASANSVAPSLNWPIVWPTKPGLECSAVFQACVATEPSASDYAKHWMDGTGWAVYRKGADVNLSAYSLDNADQFKVPVGRKIPLDPGSAVLFEAFLRLLAGHIPGGGLHGGSGLNEAFIYGHIARLRSTKRRSYTAGARQLYFDQAMGCICARHRDVYSAANARHGPGWKGFRHLLYRSYEDSQVMTAL